MKKTLISLSILLCSFAVSAKDWVQVNPNTTNSKAVKMLSTNDQTTILEFNLDGFSKEKVITPKGDAYIIGAKNASTLLEKGSPDVAKLTTSIMISDVYSTEVEVLASEYKDYENIEIAPSKGNLTRDINPSSIPYEYGKVYTKDGFYPGKLVDTKEPFILRDVRGQFVWAYPFQYNPITKTLRVYSYIKVAVKTVAIPGENPLYRNRNSNTVDTEFNEIYKSMFVNMPTNKYTPVSEEGKMLIICHAAFKTAMEPFVTWKKSMGYDVTMVDLTTTGTTKEQIKTYITNQYNTNQLKYVLLVGDAAQIPTFTVSGGGSDNSYAYIAGSDHLPELFIGRFSAETVAHVNTQVQRSINYEKNPTGTNWLNKGMVIGSAEGSGGHNGEYDFAHARLMKADLLSFTYSSVSELFDGSQGGDDAAGDPTATMVANVINAGVGVITYTGHGSDDSFVTSGFSSTNIPNLTNKNQLPFIFSVACVNGNFVSQTCFAETWLRSTKDNEPIGAVGTFMSTINQSWQPPMDGQDEMVDLLTEKTTHVKRSFCGIGFNGIIKMIEKQASASYDDADTWTCFGDPSLIVRTANPTAMTVSHAATAFIGSNSFNVDCDVNGAKVVLTFNDEIVGKGVVSSGTCNITLSNPLNTAGTMKVAVFGFNKLPYEGNVNVIAQSGAYVVMNAQTLNDVTGNNNQAADYGETIKINAIAKNVGVQAANNVVATLTTSSTLVTILDNTHNFGNIDSNSIATGNDAFEFKVNDCVADQSPVKFNIQFKDNKDSIWNSSFTIKLNAPILNIAEFIVKDSIGGANNNGRLDPGESAILKIKINNTGNADAIDAISIIKANSPYLSINPSQLTINKIDKLSNGYAMFQVTAHAAAAQGTIEKLVVDVNACSYDKDTLTLIIGQLPQIVIGNGTTESTKYPFYNYYKGNKTQILYLASEIGAGQKLITELGFDISYATTEAALRNLPNMVIKVKSTNATSLGSTYFDMTGATQVYSATSEAMPATTGWHFFDINDFQYDGTSNLVVEIVWGLLSDYTGSSDFYKVKCTTSSATRVTCGYDDSTTPASYDENSKNVPNIMFKIQGQAAGTPHNAKFVVKGESNQVLENVKVKVGCMEQYTNANGEITFNLLKGQYAYDVAKDGYSNKNEVFYINEIDTVINVNLLPLGIHNHGKATLISIYPNPAKENIHISFDRTLDNCEIEVLNMQGASILYENIGNTTSNTSKVINVSNLTNGIYLIKITSKQGLMFNKFIKE